jgi:MFS transporter, DHA2 family, multidrug resistance protein
MTAGKVCGVLLQSFRWGSVFLIGAPTMVLLVAVGPKLLPEYRNPSVGRIG